MRIWLTGKLQLHRICSASSSEVVMLFLPSCRVDAVHSDGSDVAPKGGYKVEDHHKPGSVGAEVGHMHACSEQLRLSGVVAAPMFSNID